MQVRLGRASREAESPPVDTDRVRQAGFLVVKEIGDKSNERKYFPFIWHECAQTVFWGKKVSVPTVSTVSFLIFSLKGY